MESANNRFKRDDPRVIGRNSTSDTSGHDVISRIMAEMIRSNSGDQTSRVIGSPPKLTPYHMPVTPPRSRPQTSTPRMPSSAPLRVQLISPSVHIIPGKKPRGRPRKNPIRQELIQPRPTPSNVRPLQSPSKYVADSNPQMRSRLSEDSRLSRSNIRLSKEQEHMLNRWKDTSASSKTVSSTGGQSKGSNKRTKEDDDDSSGWDSDTQRYDITDHRHKKTAKSPMNGQRSSQQSSSSNQPNGNQTNGRVNQTSNVTSNVTSSGSAVKISSSQSRPITTTQIIRADESINSNPVVNRSSINTTPQRVEIRGSTHKISEWMFHTKPKKFPYFPQHYDELVYIPYGHKLYNDTVRVLNLYHSYTIKQAKQMDSAIIYCRVNKIDFEKHQNVRFAKLTLNLIDAQTQQELNKRIMVRFHDIDNVLDFLVLRQTYDNSLNNNWKPGDHFRAIVEDKWWIGTIKDWNINEHNMSTQFQALNVVWANGATEQLSFWDLERIQGQPFVPENKNEPIEVTDKDRLKFYEPLANEWPACGKKEECKRIASALKEIMKRKEYQELKKVFNLDNRDYTEFIAYPIDLETICERTQNLFYRRHAAIKYDLKFLEKNAAKFEKKYPSIQVYENAIKVFAMAVKFIDDHNAKDFDLIYDHVLSLSPQELKKFKCYSTMRHYLNPNASNPMADPLLTPSTSAVPLQCDSSDIPLIDLSDSENEESEESFEDIAAMNTEHVTHFSSPRTEANVSSPPNRQSVPNRVSAPTSTQTVSANVANDSSVVAPPPKPTQSVRPLHSPQNRYFCIFCETYSSTREEALKHYLEEEFGLMVECVRCPGKKITSWEEYRTHMKCQNLSLSKFDKNSFDTRMKWCNKMLDYIESVADPKKEISDKFGDFCVVCKRLNHIRPDSQPFYSKDFFDQNLYKMSSYEKPYNQLLAHMKHHLMYNPTMVCTLCALQGPEDQVFTAKEVDRSCCVHIRTVHQIPSAEHPEQISSFFASSEITTLNDLMRKTKNLFVLLKHRF